LDVKFVKIKEELVVDIMDDLEEFNEESETPSNIDDLTSDSETLEDANEADLVLNTQDKDGIISGPKKTIELLLKRKKIVIGLIIAGVILLFLIIISSLLTSDTTNYIYKKSSCDSVKVHYDPYGDEEDSTVIMPLEDYVKAAVYAYTKDIEDPPSGIFHVYFSLAVALRNEAITNSCEVTYRDKKLTTSFSSNSYFEEAMQKSLGITLVDKNNNFLPMKVSDFCWQGFDNEESNYLFDDSGLNVPNSFTDVYLQNATYRDCQCNLYSGVMEGHDNEGLPDHCWIFWTEENEDEEEEEYKEYIHQDDEASYNVYGAYYLLMNYGRGYDAMLRYFYGDEIQYRTINKQNTKQDNTSKRCTRSSLPYDATPLEREEFISLVEEYFNSGHYDYGEDFKNYAGAIYDMGLDKGINPELIYIFARKECGFNRNSPDTDHYNFYGMGHCNTCAHGKFYDTFMEGVEDLYDYFVSKGSLENIVKVYSYLGDYLANPGSAGDGGCYYLKIIYGNNYSRCSSSYSCASTGGGPGCVETTQEEKDAYIAWQADQYLAHRLAIFKLGSQACEDIDTNASLDIATEQLREPLGEFLKSQGVSIQDLNNEIMDNVLDAGVGTREAVALAATTLINYMAQFDMRIPYTYGGGHYAIGGVGHSVASFFGVDPAWGTDIGQYRDPGTHYGPYTNYGPDCSAFVYWALKNGGVKFPFSGSTAFRLYGKNYAMDGNHIGKIGDVLVTSGHVMLIVDVNEEEKYYIAAEANGLVSGYRPDTKGISYQKMNFVTSGYTIVDLESYYSDSGKQYSENDYINGYNNNSLG